MAKSLKQANKLPLAAVVLANVAVLVAIVRTGDVTFANWRILLESSPSLLPAGLAVALVGVVNAFLSSDAKARIVFWKWSNPLPASEAFTKLASTDARVDVAALERKYGPPPIAPASQNREWYRLYKSVDKDQAVQQAHGEFLFSRDYACLALLMFVAFGPISLIEADSAQIAMIYSGGLLVQYLLAMRAARVHGRRFVTTVLALAGARK